MGQQAGRLLACMHAHQRALPTALAGQQQPHPPHRQQDHRGGAWGRVGACRLRCLRVLHEETALACRPFTAWAPGQLWPSVVRCWRQCAPACPVLATAHSGSTSPPTKTQSPQPYPPEHGPGPHPQGHSLLKWMLHSSFHEEFQEAMCSCMPCPRDCTQRQHKPSHKNSVPPAISPRRMAQTLIPRAIHCSHGCAAFFFPRETP